MDSLKKDVIISIKGTSTVDGETDTVELITQGTYYLKNGNYYLCYEETEATGFEGSRTVLKVCAPHKVTLLRSGERRAEMIVEPGVRHHCNYDMGYGELMIGVSGSQVQSSLGENGGELLFSYAIDVNTSLASENEVRIQVKECQN